MAEPTVLLVVSYEKVIAFYSCSFWRQQLQLLGVRFLGVLLTEGWRLLLARTPLWGRLLATLSVILFGKKDENGVLVSETDTEILAEIGKLSVQLDGIEEQLGEGFAEISKQITEGFNAGVDAVKVDAAKDNLDSITLRLSNLESRFNAFTTAGLTNLALEEQRVEFKTLCNAPNFAPEDIFRELYSHACTTCDAIQGGSKSLQYFLDLFKNGANKEAPDDAKRFRDGFGVVMMSALSRTLWMHLVCPPATDGLPRAEDVVWGTRLQEMAAAFEEVAVSLSKAEEDIEHRFFRTKKGTNLCMGAVTLQECVAGKPSVLWKHEEVSNFRRNKQATLHNNLHPPIPDTRTSLSSLYSFRTAPYAANSARTAALREENCRLKKKFDFNSVLAMVPLARSGI